MECDIRHSKEFDEVTADMNEFSLSPLQLESPEPMQITADSDELEEIMKYLTNFVPLITKRMKEHNYLEDFLLYKVSSGSFMLTTLHHSFSWML